jgi:transposase
VAAEAARHVSRERATLVAEQTRLINQMRGWVATWGAVLPRRDRAAWWTQVVDWAGQPLPWQVQDQLARASTRLAGVQAQIRELDAQQQAAVAVGATSVSTLLDEGLVWRQFRNRRQVGGLLGFAPTHYASGEVQRDQGISHAGNRHLQSVAIQVAWSWVRWQRASALTRWFLTRFGSGKRQRRVGIVALARKLLIALWRAATTGSVPAGAVLKSV